MPQFDLAWITAGLMALTLTAYVVLAGADFGGGTWQLLAFGPRKEQQREAVAKAMGPVWEANHVWLIAVIVLMFTCFPPAFAAIMTALGIPITLVLVGIMLRGSSFVFRAHAASVAGAYKSFGNIFGAASIITPILLGMCVGALGSGDIRIEDGKVTSSYFTPWLAPFPVLVGLMALALCSFLAAIFLTNETSGHLQEDFRRRAMLSGLALAVVSTIALPFCINGAPLLWEQMLWGRATPLILGTMVLGLAAIGLTYFRRYQLARIASIGEVACIVWGWAVAQAPYMVVPDITVKGAASPDVSLGATLIVWLLGSLLLFPSLWFLFKVFKGINPAVKMKDEG